jgi:hypothetical protein
MEENSKNILYAMAYPTLIMAIVVVIGAIICWMATTTLNAGETTNGLIMLMFGGTLAIAAVLYWDVATEIRLFRKDINDIKKLP